LRRGVKLERDANFWNDVNVTPVNWKKTTYASAILGGIGRRESKVGTCR
jgi:hypothetical protein